MSINEKKMTGDLSRPEPVSLRAGPFSLELHGSDIRHITLGGREVVQRIYMGLRDQNWGTLESHIVETHVDDRGDSFSVAFKAANRKGDILFDWEGRIEGDASGTIVFGFSGIARSDFPRARISLCALYPWSAREIECETRHTDGSLEAKSLPRHISPHQPFMDIASITMKFPEIGETLTTFSGETFEMEDQRNWTDASFKVYGTPIASPAPVIVHKGDRIAQNIRLECRNLADHRNTNPQPVVPVKLVPGDTPHTMPLVGVSFAPGDIGQEKFVEAVDPGLVRVYLDYARDSLSDIEKQFAAALKLPAPLLVEPFFPDPAGDALDHVRALLDKAPRAKIWGVAPLGANCDVSLPVWLDALRPLGMPLGWGSDGFPVHVNRNRPASTAVDFCAFPALPQVHSFDNVSIIDNLPGMTAVVENARAFQTAPVVVAPITFNWRSNPVAVAPEPARADDSSLPVGVDLRQQALFGAAWTAACVQALSEGGASAAVFFETVAGWKGLRELERPESVSADFPVSPGEVFPVAAALHWIMMYSGGEMLSFAPAPVRGVGGFSVKNRRRKGIFLYNTTRSGIPVSLIGCGGTWLKRTLDERVVGAIPADLRIEAERRAVSAREECLLPPCSLIYLESAE